MADQANVNFAEWLQAALLSTDLADEVPAEMLKSICDRAGAAGLSDRTFNADGLIDALVDEYGLARDRVTGAVLGLADQARGVGFEIKSSAAPAATPPHKPLPTRTPPAAAARPMQSDRYHLFADDKYWAKMYRDYVVEGKEPGDKLLDLVISSFGIPREEFEFFSRKLDPEFEAFAKVHADAQNWVVRVNGFALCYEMLAMSADADDDAGRDQLLQILKRIVDEAGGLSARTMGKLTEYRRVNYPHAPIFEAAVKRLQSAQKKTNLAYDRVFALREKKPAPAATSRTAAPAKAASAPARPRAVETRSRGPVGEFVQQNALILLIVLGLIALGGVGYMLMYLGVFSGDGVKEITADFSKVGVKVVKAESKNLAMRVVVDENQWRGLKEEDKLNALEALRGQAVGLGLNQVKIENATGTILAFAWGGDKRKLF